MKSAKTGSLEFSGRDFLTTALPIVETDAFARLRQITFLGILSREFGEVDGHPLGVAGARDQTRAHHSLKVALLAARIIRSNNLSFTAQKYAIAWGLLHDIATWPLSHTGEAAFSGATSVPADGLRSSMIKGDASVGIFSVLTSLRATGIDPELLLAIFDKNTIGLEGDLAVVHQLVHSPLTPDTLEGMDRSGRVLGVNVPPSSCFIPAMERDLVAGLSLKGEYSSLAFKFWRGKSKIYRDFINNERTVSFESTWSNSIRENYVGIALIDSLALSEKEIVDRIFDRGLQHTSDVVRYKAPLKYGVAERYKTRRVLKEPMPLGDLSEVFVKSRA